MSFLNKGKVVFPKTHIKSLYYQIHIQYLIEFFKQIGYEITYGENTSTSDTSFILQINDTKRVVDFSDFQALTDPSNLPCIKLHCSKELLTNPRKIIPFPSVSFYNWEQYRELSEEIEYNGCGELILNMQRPYAGALERRLFVQTILKQQYRSMVDVRYNVNQVDYWKRINECLVAVFVPGARNDMLDRGHMQYIAFGCCTIAPFISDVMGFGKELVPYAHYIMCKEDYSDLTEKIEWCKQNREICRMIGNSAKMLFESCCIPDSLKEIL